MGIARIRRWDFAVVPAALWVAVFYGYPVIGSLVTSFTSFVSPQRGGLDNYRWFFDASVNVTVLERTFATAAIVTAVCLLLGFPYAYLMTTVSSRWRTVMLAAVLLPFWTSLLVRSFAWIGLLQQHGPVDRVLSALGIHHGTIIGTTTGVVIGMTQLLLPFMVLPLYAVLRGIDRQLLTAAASLGARPATAFRKVYLPLAIPGVVAGAMLVFVLALGFFVTPALLGSPQNSLLSQLIVTQTNTLLAFGRAGAMSMILLLSTAVLLGVAGLFLRRARVRHLYAS
jgi:putative spermidine/putrescine transport system permease protein